MNTRDSRDGSSSVFGFLWAPDHTPPRQSLQAAKLRRKPFLTSARNQHFTFKGRNRNEAPGSLRKVSDGAPVRVRLACWSLRTINWAKNRSPDWQYPPARDKGPIIYPRRKDGKGRAVFQARHPLPSCPLGQHSVSPAVTAPLPHSRFSSRVPGGLPKKPEHLSLSQRAPRAEEVLSHGCSKLPDTLLQSQVTVPSQDRRLDRSLAARTSCAHPWGRGPPWCGARGTPSPQPLCGRT